MKKFTLCFLLPLAMLTACTNLLDNGRINNGKLTIQATFEAVDNDSATKTTLHDDAHVYWNPGDAISLFYGSGTDGGSKFVADIQSDNRISSFSGNIGAVTGVAESNAEDLMFWGLYPYDESAACDGQTVTVKISDSQKGMAGTFAPGYAPSLGRAPGLLLSFRNIYSGMWFTMTEAGFQSITFSMNNGELITGTAKIGVDGSGLPEVRQIVTGTSSVTITAPTSAGFEVGKKYYAVFYPQTASGGFTVELKSAAKTGTFIVTKSVNFRRNYFNYVTDLDTKCTFTSENEGNTEPIDGGNDPDIPWE